MTIGTTTASERKILDLDALIPATQYVRLDGVEHAVIPASVDMYLTILQKKNKMKMADEDLEKITQAVELISLACPTISRKRLGELPLVVLTTLTDIIEEQMGNTETAGGTNAPDPNTDTGE